MTQKIMVQTKEKTFFVHKKNLPLLIEFAKTFKAKLAVVEVAGSEVTELSDLPILFCDQNFKTPNVEYKELQVLYPDPNLHPQKTRAQILADAKKIKRYIKSRFHKKGKVSLKELKKQFEELCVTDSCLSNHLANVRKELKKEEGAQFATTAKGTYELVK